MVFDNVEDVWQWPPVTPLASKWQLTGIACKVSHKNHFD